MGGMDQRAGQPQFLFHATGERPRQSLAKRQHVSSRQHRISACSPDGPWHLKEVSVETDVLVHREVFIKAKSLGHIADMPFGLLRLLSHINAVNHYTASICLHHPCQYA